MRHPMTIARSASGSESAGTSAAPATMTSRETPRFPPEEPGVERPEHAQPLGDGIDPPAGQALVLHRGASLPGHLPQNACVIPRYFVLAESSHELQNPTSREKIVDIGARIGLGLVSRAGHRIRPGGPALFLASEFGCTIEGIEVSPDFHAVAVERIAAAGLAEQVSFLVGDASKEELRPMPTTPPSVSARASSGEALAGRSTRSSRRCDRAAVVVGEPYWRRRRCPTTTRSAFLHDARGHRGRLREGGLVVTAMVVSSEDDWDRYETSTGMPWRSGSRQPGRSGRR